MINKTSSQFIRKSWLSVSIEFEHAKYNFIILAFIRFHLDENSIDNSGLSHLIKGEWR